MSNNTFDQINPDKFRRNWPDSYNYSIGSVMQTEHILQSNRLKANSYIASAIEMSDNTGRWLAQAKLALDSTIQSMNLLMAKVKLTEDSSKLQREMEDLKQLVMTHQKSSSDRLNSLEQRLIALTNQVNERASNPTSPPLIKVIASKVGALLGR